MYTDVKRMWKFFLFIRPSILDKTEFILTWMPCNIHGVNAFSAWVGKCSFKGTMHGCKDRSIVPIAGIMYLILFLQLFWTSPTYSFKMLQSWKGGICKSMALNKPSNSAEITLMNHPYICPHKQKQFIHFSWHEHGKQKLIRTQPKSPSLQQGTHMCMHASNYLIQTAYSAYISHAHMDCPWPWR